MEVIKLESTGAEIDTAVNKVNTVLGVVGLPDFTGYANNTPIETILQIFGGADSFRKTVSELHNGYGIPVFINNTTDSIRIKIMTIQSYKTTVEEDNESSYYVLELIAYNGVSSSELYRYIVQVYGNNEGNFMKRLYV